ncbi:MAG: hypothetical protein QOH79_2409 [Acidimicrobiaceae bacterium]
MTPNRQQRRKAARSNARREGRSRAPVPARRGDDEMESLTEPPEGSRPRRGGDPGGAGGGEGAPPADESVLLRQLAAIHRERVAFERREAELARAARSAGASWGAIGKALDCSRQWARERHGKGAL